MKTSNAEHDRQRRTLMIVLILNGLLFVGLGLGGLLANSSALLANALDNASDSLVYLISFLAVGRALAWKLRAARTSGVLLLIFAAGVLIDAGRRWWLGTEPIGWTMIGLAVVAAVVNLICLKLLRGLKGDDVNLRAAETFSFNDFASNGGILVAGALVLWLKQSWPDLVVGVIVAGIAAKGGLEILEGARKINTQRASDGASRGG